MRPRWIGILAGAAVAAAAGRYAGPAGAQDSARLQMGVRVTPETVTVGDPFLVVLRIRAPRGSQLRFPGIDSVEAVEPLDPPRLSGSDTGVVDQSATYRVVAWDVGEVEIPLGDVVVEAGGSTRRIPVEGANVFVRSVLPEDTTLHVPKPARDLMSAPAPWWKWWLVGAVAALLLGLLLWAWWRYRRRARAPVEIDPRELAEREFRRIEGMGLVEAGERERYVALMVEVLRDYLARRVPEARSALTSQELIAAVRKDPRIPSSELAPVLDDSDLVKFARVPITPERARELGKETRRIVEQVDRKAAAATTREDAA